MLSKSQAEVAADALLESAEKQRDKQSPLLARFPELAEVPLREREAMVAAAHKAALRSAPIVTIFGAAFALAALWIWALLAQWGNARHLAWTPLLLMLSLRSAMQRGIRKELRRRIAQLRPVQ